MKALNVRVGTDNATLTVTVSERKIASLYDLINQRRCVVSVPLKWFEPVQRQTNHVRRTEYQQHWLEIAPTGDPVQDPWCLLWKGNGIESWQTEVYDKPGAFLDVLREFVGLLIWSADWQEVA